MWGSGAAAKPGRGGLNYALTTDSSPGAAPHLLHAKVVVIRGRTGTLVPRSFLEDTHTITALTLPDGMALRVLRRPISCPD